MRLYTIGFTKKNAEEFFRRLQKAGVERVIDVRLNNKSQLAGFAKQDDLKFFLKSVAGIQYQYKPEWAPTQEILDNYKKKKGTWLEYERSFNELLEERQIEKIGDRKILENSCLLCSEDTAEHCHRRLVAEYLKKHYKEIEVCHL
jgi:uncharacterized protein (DUF488 family)